MKYTINPSGCQNHNVDLLQVIEPLASYICASGRPRAALRSVLAALFRQVEQTNQAADASVDALLRSRTVLPARASPAI